MKLCLYLQLLKVDVASVCMHIFIVVYTECICGNETDFLQLISHYTDKMQCGVNCHPSTSTLYESVLNEVSKGGAIETCRNRGVMPERGKQAAHLITATRHELQWQKCNMT